MIVLLNFSLKIGFFILITRCCLQLPYLISYPFRSSSCQVLLSSFLFYEAVRLPILSTSYARCDFAISHLIWYAFSPLLQASLSSSFSENCVENHVNLGFFHFNLLFSSFPFCLFFSLDVVELCSLTWSQKEISTSPWHILAYILSEELFNYNCIFACLSKKVASFFSCELSRMNNLIMNLHIFLQWYYTWYLDP